MSAGFLEIFAGISAFDGPKCLTALATGMLILSVILV